MGPFEMVVAIVAITAIASVIRARYGVDTERLRAEVKALKERVAVLERLATDGSTALEREFEKLRDRD